MNTEKIVALTCLLSLSGMSARAQQINWNGNPLQQFQTALAEQKAVMAPQARLVELKDAPPVPTVNLEGKALGSTVIGSHSSAYNYRIKLIFNKESDRAGARFDNCPAYTEIDFPTPTDCRLIDFAFPQLTVDAKTGVVKFGEETVASTKFFGKPSTIFLATWSLNKGWRFVVTKKRQTIDDGFNRRTITRVAVSLVK